MKFRSSGLGQTELACVGMHIQRQEDLLVMHIRSVEPVQWHMRAGVEPRDVPILVAQLLKPRVLFCILKALLKLKVNPFYPEDFWSESVLPWREE